ncbi:YeiH family protein [Pacificibacter marinus]|uniref:YeiH family protein n=1 Tax=Pacificibacter marinus TaxID=658057 RepID=UPI001C0753ED|nr:putative sulfate exporter family transporter [Pacificibacter marinus]MBU2865820.1 putative sulfate exporter family transporter [Pacificibacter marinus]
MLNLKHTTERIFPGLVIAGLVAVTAQFLSEHYGAPAMLMAILLGISLQFLSEETRTEPGVAFAAKGLLRFGVALLGARISIEMLQALGPALVALIIIAVILTILFSLLIGRFFGRGMMFAFLTGGSVAICGASAAMAIASILPKGETRERDLVFTVVSVTVLSTIAMIFYPILADILGLNLRQSGVFLGGTIHDVAQVVGAGYSISEETGDLATVVKLIRVTMLAPVVLIASMFLRKYAEPGEARPPLLPGFVLAFLIIAALNSFHVLPEVVRDLASVVSRWALLTAIAAVGMKTSIPRILQVGGPAIGLLVVQSIFLAGFVLVGAFMLG